MRVIRTATGAPEGIALKAASEMIRTFQQRFAGAQLYIPHPARYDETAILSELRPDNVLEVCARHHVHRSTVYRIVARARRRGAAVPDLPPQPAATATESGAALPRRAGKPEDFSW